MTIQIDTTKLQDSEQAPLIHAFIAPEHQYPEPKAGVEGISFPDIPMLRQATKTGGIAFGTITVGSEPFGHAAYEELRFDVMISVNSEPGAIANVSEQYARLRAAMEADGLPLLDDEELRREIEERKGIRPEWGV